MTKDAYLKKLKGKLKRLPQEEVEAAVDYYSEYFDDAGEENTEQVILQLGSPSNVASQILADAAMKDLTNHPKSTTKNISAIWLILIAIVTAPISLPILGSVLGIIIAMVAVAFALLFSLFMIVVSFVIGGIATFLSGLFVLTDHLPTAILFIGIGLVISGLGLLLISPFVGLVKKTSQSFAQAMGKLFKKIMQKRKEGF